MTNYPLRLRAEIKSKVWGGRNLEKILGKVLPPHEMIGETWEAWDGLAIENGAARGELLRDVIARDAEGILGAPGNFPLLFKFIDAQDDLSVQVHPDDARAREIENRPFGKTEAWLILYAEPGSRLVYGFNREVDRVTVAAHIRANTLTDLLAFLPVQSGDVIFVPAGMVHAIGKGIVLAEIQQNSDTTYRLYDWDRVGTDRALHIEQSLRVASFNRVADPKIPALTIQHAEFDQQFLIACRYFAFEKIILRGRARATLDHFHIVSMIAGDAMIEFGSEQIAIARGETIIIPARLGAYSIATKAHCEFLRASVPDLRRDVVEPLARAGHSPENIARLGGPIATHNDLLPLV
ncbi:MAG: class I mannose-6-phosphate isomerase [Chloroflexi bacterium]|nr:class I mannose-6-phosphate isomerase [Chloroflexota bacterium]